jgi:GPH family glycoside/pentoside/hexuronide:cation symporter
VAREQGLKTMVGAWISHDRDRNEREIDGADLAQAGLVDIAVVGNEVLLRGDLPEAELLAYIRASEPPCPKTCRWAASTPISSSWNARR